MQDADLKVTVEAGPSLKRALSPILEEVERLKGRVRELELGEPVGAGITEFLDAQDPEGEWTLNAAAGSWVEGFPPEPRVWLVAGPELGVQRASIYYDGGGILARVGPRNIRPDHGAITHHACIFPPKTEATDGD